MIFITFGLDTRPFFEKMFFAPRKAENTYKNISKFAKNEVKVAVLAVPCSVSLTTWHVGHTAWLHIDAVHGWGGVFLWSRIPSKSFLEKEKKL